MPTRQNRYQSFERNLTYGLCANTAIFILYMIFAGMGIVWLKVILAIISLFLSGGMVALLYLTRELTKRRSQWIAIAAAALLLCQLFSLILNFPSPKPQMPVSEESSAFVTE